MHFISQATELHNTTLGIVPWKNWEKVLFSQGMRSSWSHHNYFENIHSCSSHHDIQHIFLWYFEGWIFFSLSTQVHLCFGILAIISETFFRDILRRKFFFFFFFVNPKSTFVWVDIFSRYFEGWNFLFFFSLSIQVHLRLGWQSQWRITDGRLLLISGPGLQTSTWCSRPSRQLGNIHRHLEIAARWPWEFSCGKGHRCSICQVSNFLPPKIQTSGGENLFGLILISVALESSCVANQLGRQVQS